MKLKGPEELLGMYSRSSESLYESHSRGGQDSSERFGGHNGVCPEDDVPQGVGGVSGENSAADAKRQLDHLQNAAQ